MLKPLLIHNNNTSLIDTIANKIGFNLDNMDYDVDDLDSHITKKYLSLVSEREFDILFIKDTLSENYLDLYGLLLAYHIRLSVALGSKRFLPIVILCDLDGYIINKLSPAANILFTEGIFIGKNEKSTLDFYINHHDKLPTLNQANFKKEFLDKIKIDPPQDYLSHHSIANEWSIYRWAEFLGVESEATRANKAKIENMLYFKYLKAKYATKDESVEKTIKTINTLTKKGKVLLIDDEWSKGWSDILNVALKKDGVEFKTFEYEYKDKSEFNLIVQLKHKELTSLIENADVIILDLRLLESDHKNEEIENFTGIKILEKIHEINAGIQVIMLTATSKSTILEKLYEKKILGYIKKEHPDDISIDTVENINKLVGLVDKGFERNFLKSIHVTKTNILTILKNDIFAQYGIPFKKYELFWKKITVEVKAVFDILDSDRENRFLYATVSIAVSMESILSIFIRSDRNKIFWDGERYECEHNALRCRIQKLFDKLGSNENFDMGQLIDKRNDYMHDKPVEVSPDEVTPWFEKLRIMIKNIQTPPNPRLYDRNNIAENINNIFN